MDPFSLVAAERAVFRRLTTPEKIQRFLDDLAYNKERDGETCRSPRRVLRDRTAHCMEGALFGAAAGRDFMVSDLRHQGFDAVLIAVGAHRSRDLTIPGVDLDGVYKGIDFLLNVNLGYKFTIGKKVIVIGGGNVAMDVARSAAREVVRRHVAGVE